MNAKIITCDGTEIDSSPDKVWNRKTYDLLFYKNPEKYTYKTATKEFDVYVIALNSGNNPTRFMAFYVSKEIMFSKFIHIIKMFTNEILLYIKPISE